MKTFKEFILCLERYYEPQERLPSGRTPVQKAETKSRTRAKTIARQSPQNQERWAKQYDLTQTHVKHGGDNPNYNMNISHRDKDKLEIEGDGKNSIEVYHKPSGVRMYADRNDDGSHSLEWTAGKTSAESEKLHTLPMKDRIKMLRTVGHVHKKYFLPRLPNNAIVHNTPLSSGQSPSGKNKFNKRAQLYSQYGGMGPVDDEGDQYGRVKRNLSSKQMKPPKTSRIQPLDPQKAKEMLGYYGED